MYVLIKDGKVEKFPYSILNFRDEYKNISFPEEITEKIYNEYGIYTINGPGTIPPFDGSIQKLELPDPIFIDGLWTSFYQVVSLDPETLAKNQTIIAQREVELLQTRLVKIQTARRDWLNSQIDPDGISLALMLHMKGNAKGTAMYNWSIALAEESNKRQSELELHLIDWNDNLLDFSMFPKPYTIKELIAEV